MEKQHSILSNLHFLFTSAWKATKAVVFYMLGHIPIIVLIPLVTSYLERDVVAMVSEQVPFEILVIQVGKLALVLALLNVLNMTFAHKTKVKGTFVRFNYIVENSVKVMDADYANIEGPEAQEMLRKSEDAVAFSNRSMTQQIFRVFTLLIANLLGLFLYSSLIFSLNHWIVALLIVLSAMNYMIAQRNLAWWNKTRNNWSKVERKRGYLREKICEIDAAKDVRLYRLMRWFKSSYVMLMNEMRYWRKQEAHRNIQADSLGILLNGIRDGIAYAVLLTQVVRLDLTIAEFVFYFSLITQYSTWFTGVFTAINALGRMQIQINDLRTFWDMPDDTNRGSGAPVPNTEPDIIFDHISFRYKGAEKDTLQNINFHIHPGEKIALVGLNGAGKTTIVKLLCNLYRPTSGQILINGKPLSAYNRDELWKIYSVVFQDVHIMPLTIAENIALVPLQNIDQEKLGRVIKLAGLHEKILSLPERANTLLVKQVHSQAVSFSGGELQKLALARALYKAGKIIVLDEPTAAIDPIAESKLYEHYSKLTEGCSSLYISHRLSSTQFCDRVIYLENGIIQEEGSHQELMSFGGKYAQLFALQSDYYQAEAGPV